MRVLLALLSLLTLTTSAHAECAWVLWVHEVQEWSVEGMANPAMAWKNSKEVWSIEEGFASAKDCSVARPRRADAIAKALADSGWKIRSAGDGTLRGVLQETLPSDDKQSRDNPLLRGVQEGMKGAVRVTTTYRELKCLPDTIDPRGPKGK